MLRVFSAYVIRDKGSGFLRPTPVAFRQMFLQYRKTSSSFDDLIALLKAA